MQVFEQLSELPWQLETFITFSLQTPYSSSTRSYPQSSERRPPESPRSYDRSRNYSSGFESRSIEQTPTSTRSRDFSQSSSSRPRDNSPYRYDSRPRNDSSYRSDNRPQDYRRSSSPAPNLQPEERCQKYHRRDHRARTVPIQHHLSSALLAANTDITVNSAKHPSVTSADEWAISRRAVELTWD